MAHLRRGAEQQWGRRFRRNSYGAYTGQDFRFTTKDGALYALSLGWPDGGVARLTTLAQGSAIGRGRVEGVTLLGAGPLPFRRTDKALEMRLPEGSRGAPVRVLKILGDELTGR